MNKSTLHTVPFSAKRKLRQLGQGMSEYLIITALIAVAGIGVVGFLGDSINNQMASMAQEVAGQDGSAATGRAGAAGTAADGNATTAKNLSNFSSAN